MLQSSRNGLAWWRRLLLAASLPIGNGMRDGTPEPRTPVMILVDASWEDQNGTTQRTRARIENKSSGGACIRLSEKVAVGTRLKIEGQWEKFTGEARYCRQDGRDYLVGIQKDKTEWPSAKRVVGKEGIANTLPDLAALLERRKEREESKVAEASKKEPRAESVPIASIVDAEVETSRMEAPSTGRDHDHEEERSNELEGLKKKEERVVQASVVREASEERKPMRRKWFEMGHKEEEEAMEKNEKQEVTSRMPATTFAPLEAVVAEGEKESEAEAQLELLSMEDIYRVAGIVAPRKGYSINKLVEMLHSKHLRGLSKEMKRASVLMALNAAGITVDEVLQDAKARQDAIDSFEAHQRKQFEAQLACKADENAQIQAEMERVKARYTERLRRNLDGMAREKATFGHWLTAKQQESESMREAVELCLKPPVAEKASTPLEEVSLAGARVKPV